ncbi:hypothetical protein [Methanosarcina sp.]|uniref:AbrB/MazE/SpoVT family DNA-binding domain-containing protein n=1 Tax=Methanosarcina sp. TaxID=2213 RepID=UPI003BB8155C
MVTAQIKKTGGSYFIYIPPTIMELMGLQEGDTVRVPFLEFEKVASQEEKREEGEEEGYELSGETAITVKLRNHEPVTITRDDVLKLLENPSRDMLSYRTAYLIWNGKRYGIKKVFAKLIGFNDFNTVEGEKYLKDLGFKTDRVS